MDDSQLRPDYFRDHAPGMEISDRNGFRTCADGCISSGGMAWFRAEYPFRGMVDQGDAEKGSKGLAPGC